MRYPEKIYEQAKDLHVRNIVLYNVNNQIAYDSAGTKLLSKEEIVDAFLKGCVVNNNGSYITPTGVNVDGDTATLVFDGGGSSELPPEVSNAVETHGMGYTTEEPVPAINITWDGDKTGKEPIYDIYYKVSDDILCVNDIIGATMVGNTDLDYPFDIVLTEENIEIYDDYAYIENFLVAAWGTSVISETGVYFGDDGSTTYTRRLYKEASTQEVVHQIDEKYIPSSGVMVVNFEIDEENNITADKTVEEVLSAVKTSVVIGNFNIPDFEYIPLGICHLSDGRLGLMPVFGIIGQGQDGTLQDGTFMISFYGDEDGWHRNII